MVPVFPLMSYCEEIGSHLLCFRGLKLWSSQRNRAVVVTVWRIIVWSAGGAVTWLNSFYKYNYGSCTGLWKTKKTQEPFVDIPLRSERSRLVHGETSRRLDELNLE